MPDYNLAAGPVTLVPQGISVRIIRSDEPAELQARRATAIPRDVGLPPDRLYVREEQVDGAVISVAAARNGTFAVGTVIALELSTTPTRNGAVSSVRLDRLPVGGMARVDAVKLEIIEGQLLVSVATHEVLDGLAGAAQVAAARVLGLSTHHVPAGRSRELALSVDASASMAAWVADGSVGAVADVLLGIDQVLGTNEGILVCLAGRGGRWQLVPAGTVRELVGGWKEEPPRESGSVTPPPTPPQHSRIHLTDHVPATGAASDAVLTVVLAEERAAGVFTEWVAPPSVHFLFGDARGATRMNLAESHGDALNALIRAVLDVCYPGRNEGSFQ